MKYEVLRISSGKDSTSGMLFEVDNNTRTFLAYTLEDEQRDVKVWGETRIPAGTYKLKLRKEGGFHTRYLAKYGDTFHKGMIWVQDVPGFEWILWHTGNTDEHTAGCLILGNTQTNNRIAKDGFIGSSVDAYKFVYPRVAAAIDARLDVEVTYIDYDGDVKKISNKSTDDVILAGSVMDKLSEISGEIQVMSAKLDGRKID
nr:probable peptidase [uncultured Mediterranean phage uvMED]